MTHNHCTTPGYDRAQTLRARLKRDICCDGDNAFTQTGSNSIRESDIDEVNEAIRQEGLAGLSLGRINDFLVKHRPLPAPTSFDVVSIGSMVTINYKDDHYMLQTKKYVIGGEDEPELYKKQKIPIVCYKAALGAKLFQKQKGEEIELKQGSKTYSATIVDIGLPPEPDVLEPEKPNTKGLEKAA